MLGEDLEATNWTADYITNFDNQFKKGEYQVVEFEGMQVKIPKGYKLVQKFKEDTAVDQTEGGDLLELKVCANGFLYNMARAMAGTVVYAAEGKIKPSEIGAILDSGNRTAAGPTVPPGGLYMTHLWYDDGVEKFECPDRAENS